ncbi:MAG: bifunctional pyr operon transcriptional regulator/uracil phosphoribosyltransferase PyrR, partial [Verrucomicrobia bacterium]
FTPTLIPIDVTDAVVILVDDVLQSGRTVKAALNELFDHGRPAKVELAILVDRGGRTLPVAADYTGLVLSARDDEKVTVVLHSSDPSADAISVVGPARPLAES